MEKEMDFNVADLGLTFEEEQSTLDEMTDLDEEQDPALADLTEHEKAVFKKVIEKQAQLDPILSGFKNLETRPTDSQIEEWKKQHGKVFTIGFSEDEYFIFRALRRLEWRNLMKALAKQEDEMKRSEAICQRAVLWPSLTPELLAKSSAGTPDTLHQMILQASNFLMPQEALACIRKL